MKTRKTVEFVTYPQEAHWVGDGFRVHNLIPGTPGLSMRDMDPFILLDYNAPLAVAPSDEPRGVGVHPHRGFETVTIAYDGEVEHRDSAGNGGVIRSGDCQWMTAAGGVLHREHYSEAFHRAGGTFHMVQLWTNLPRVNKMDRPSYQTIVREQMGRYDLPNNGGVVEVIAGSFDGVQGAARTHSPIHLMNARLHEGGKAEFVFPSHYNTAVLVVQGSVVIDETHDVPTHNIAKFNHDGEAFTLRATAPDTIALVMSGEPLNEPIVAYGPFVMNSKQEILQAYDDFNQGRFGTLEEVR